MEEQQAYKGRRALITGISGQDGSYLAEFLLEKGYDVFGLMRPIEKHDNIKHIMYALASPHNPFKGEFTIIQGDLKSETDIKNALIESNPDEVYNLGAQSHVGFSFEDAIDTGDVTGLGVVRMLEAIKRFNKRIKFYQASTSELFGNSPMESQHELTIMQPTSPYAAAKLYGYHMVKIYRESYGMFAVNGILFNHESPRRGLNFVTRKITHAAAQIKLGVKKDKLMLGNLDAKRDWGYAKEYVEAMWKMLQHNSPQDMVIGTGELHSVRDFAREAFAAAGLDWLAYIHEDENLYRPTDVLSLKADCTKAKNLIGWEPKVKFTELVRIMVDADIESNLGKR
jgi:GDPmannose 4,6-dehydratase